MLGRFNKDRNTHYKQVFNSGSGLAVLADLAKVCNAYTSTHVTGDTHQTSFNEGKRHVYNYILSILEQNDALLQRQYYQDIGAEQLRSILEIEKEQNLYD